MSGSAAKCFKNSSNSLKSSNDYIEKKKAKTIYKSIINNFSIRKNDESQYNGPVFINKCGFLGAIGGYNTQNYDLLLNVAKGKAYSESQCIIIDSSSIYINNTNETCINILSKCANQNSTYDLYEGPFLLKTNPNNTNNLNCESKIIKEYSYYDPSNITATSYPFNKLVNNNKLQNLYLHSKLPLISFIDTTTPISESDPNIINLVRFMNLFDL